MTKCQFSYQLSLISYQLKVESWGATRTKILPIRINETNHKYWVSVRFIPNPANSPRVGSSDRSTGEYGRQEKAVEEKPVEEKPVECMKEN